MKSNLKHFVYVVCFTLLLTNKLQAQVTTIVSYNSSWRYLDNNTRPVNWETVAYNDATPLNWTNGNAILGYSGTAGAVNTVISYGADAANKYISSYFRKVVNIVSPATYTNFTLNVKRDDGCVVYINGVEKFRSNLPVSPAVILHNTLATLASDNGTTPVTITLPSTDFVNGNNTIAVEMHQANVTSSDVIFDLELNANGTPPAIIPFNSSWKYLDNNTNPAGWETTLFNDASWLSANGILGYGDGQVPQLNFGSDANNKFITTYFRRQFNITNVNSYSDFVINVKRDDGCVVYLNGVEVKRDNLPTGTIMQNTLALAAIAQADEGTPITFNLCASNFVEGQNTIAVEMHQNTANSSDLSFDLQLVGTPIATGTPTLTRNPYLQMGKENSINIRWRTNIACVGTVQLGTAFGTYTLSTNNENCATTEHEITINGLTADTKYFYKISSGATSLQETTSNFFRTLPPANTTRKLRFAVFGDCGRNDNSFQTQSLAQYQSFLTTNGVDAADAMILLGDNAYNSGTETEYIDNFFTPFGTSILRNHKLYPAPGNHDYYNSTLNDRNNPYYRNFTMPTNGEIGGVASNTEAFYSYNIGDVHFLALDSYGEETGNTKLYDTLGAQVLWIKNDLAANTKKWVIAYWHHPPYTMGSHNSDTETDLVAMRENFIRILERNGIDMILNGHSHDYERSYLLKGYYKQNPADPALNEVNFNVATHAVNSSSAKYNASANSCTYTTNSGKYNHGTVYVVSGSAGADGGVNAGYPHNAFPFSQDDGGMFYFEVENNRLDAKFIRRDGIIADNFTIMKDVNQVRVENIAINNSVILTASWIGTYSWSTGATTRSITVTPTTVSTVVYTVTDGLGCVSDQITVNALNALPVNITSYNLSVVNASVENKWVTATEKDNKFFTIEHSTNGIDFTFLQNVNSYGNSNIPKQYNFTHTTPTDGINYYRLSQTNLNNQREYLGIRKIDLNHKRNVSIKVINTKNPTTIECTASKADTYTLNVLDISGRTITSQKLKLSNTPLLIKLDVKAGVYVAEILDKSGEKVVERIAIY
jgi:acid phosphatase type 7